MENFATSVVDTGGKFATGAVETGGNFAAGVVDTSGKFATGFVETDGAPWRLTGKLIHEKNQKQKIPWHCPFKSRYTYFFERKQFPKIFGLFMFYNLMIFREKIFIVVENKSLLIENHSKILLIF